jgi:spore coat protein CotH
MPAENDWILNAPYSDKTLMRNVLAYELSRRIGRYAPRTKLCELVLNGEYQGVYVLIEKIKQDDHRVGIADLNHDEIHGDDLTGGYIIKRDKLTASNCPGWSTSEKQVLIQNEYPECDEIQPEQQTYISQYLNDFEKSLYSDDYQNPNTGYRAYLDVPSAIDYFFINEIGKNIDGYRLSTFLHKDKNSEYGKLHFGPVWDFNLAFCNANYFEGYSVENLKAEENLWWKRMLQDSLFHNELKTRWVDYRESRLSDENIVAIIDSLASSLEEAQNRNFQKWPVMGEFVWPNYFIGQSYEEEVEFMKSWILDRLTWLDDNLPGIYMQIINPVAPDQSVSLYPNPFTNFFNLDFYLSQEKRVTIKLYDSYGQYNRTLTKDHIFPKGENTYTHYTDDDSFYLTGSIYFITLEVDGVIIAIRKAIRS